MILDCQGTDPQLLNSVRRLREVWRQISPIWHLFNLSSLGSEARQAKQGHSLLPRSRYARTIRRSARLQLDEYLGRVYNPGRRKNQLFSAMAATSPFGFWFGAIQGGALKAHLI